MRIIKTRDEGVNGWYYADAKGGRVSPTYEHEGLLDKWAEVNGAFKTFVVFKRNLQTDEESLINHYGDYETAQRSCIMEKRSADTTQFFISIREETWIANDEMKQEEE